MKLWMILSLEKLWDLNRNTNQNQGERKLKKINLDKVFFYKCFISIAIWKRLFKMKKTNLVRSASFKVMTRIYLK